MAQKHLHELLQEDQEPFQLKHFIADRRSQLKKLDKIVKKQKPISSNTTLLCKHACFFSVRDQSSPYAEKLSPINFHHHHYSPSSATRKSPVRGMTSLHIPAKTSSLLLEAAMRIQQRQNHHQPKPKKIQMGFGLFGSILKKIMSKKNNITTTNGITMRREQTTSTTTTGADELRRIRQFSNNTGCSEKHMMKTNKTISTTEPTSRRQFSSTTSCSEKRMIDDETCSCNHSRLSSSGWSETNETSSSCCRSDTEENELDNGVINGDFGSCESPLSPFRFSLQKCPSSTGCRTPEFASSPAASPVCHKNEDKENYDGLTNIEQEEDEKEQCSPVSVLDPPFDDDDGHEICEYEYEDEDEEDDDDYCNYALVQRAQQQLLYKLRRFEKLAELDPIELEKLMLDEEEEGNDDLVDDIDDDDSMLSYKDCDFETFASEVTIPFDMKRLVSDLISEEKTETKTSNNGEEEVVFGRVCKRLDSWQHVRSDTIDMMIESDLKNELDAWKKFQEQREETALEVEVEIFRLLVEELAEEIVYFDGHYGICNEVLAS